MIYDHRSEEMTPNFPSELMGRSSPPVLYNILQKLERPQDFFVCIHDAPLSLPLSPSVSLTGFTPVEAARVTTTQIVSNHASF